MKAINKEQLKHKIKEGAIIAICWLLAIFIVYVVYLKIKLMLNN